MGSGGFIMVPPSQNSQINGRPSSIIQYKKFQKVAQSQNQSPSVQKRVQGLTVSSNLTKKQTTIKQLYAPSQQDLHNKSVVNSSLDFSLQASTLTKKGTLLTGSQSTRFKEAL